MPVTGSNADFRCLKDLSCSFELSSTASYHISILLRPDGFSFCVVSPETHACRIYRDYAFASESLAGQIWDVTAVGAYAAAVRQIIAQDAALHTMYGRCRIFVDFPLVTRVPGAFFVPDAPEGYFRPYPPGAMDGMAFFSEPAGVGSDHLVFGIPQPWTELWQGLSREPVTWAHAATALCDLEAVPSEEPLMKLLVAAGHVTVSLQRDGKMLHYNYHPAELPADVLYFAMGAMRRHGVAPGRCEVRCVSSSPAVPAGSVADLLQPYVLRAECPVATWPGQPVAEEAGSSPLLLQPCV